MMTDEILKAVAENKVKEFEKEILRLREELTSEEEFNLWAWAEYGSELCGGEVVANERKIRIKINEVRGKITLLHRLIEGGLDISREEKLKINSELVSAQITTLQDSKKVIDYELAEIAMVKNLMV